MHTDVWRPVELEDGSSSSSDPEDQALRGCCMNGCRDNRRNCRQSACVVPLGRCCISSSLAVAFESSPQNLAFSMVVGVSDIPSMKINSTATRGEAGHYPAAETVF